MGADSQIPPAEGDLLAYTDPGLEPTAVPDPAWPTTRFQRSARPTSSRLAPWFQLKRRLRHGSTIFARLYEKPPGRHPTRRRRSAGLRPATSRISYAAAIRRPPTRPEVLHGTPNRRLFDQTLVLLDGGTMMTAGLGVRYGPSPPSKAIRPKPRREIGGSLNNLRQIASAPIFKVLPRKTG